jgi:hypothetical protein
MNSNLNTIRFGKICNKKIQYGSNIEVKYPSHRYKNMHFAPKFRRISTSRMLNKSVKIFHFLKTLPLVYIYICVQEFFDIFEVFGLFVFLIYESMRYIIGDNQT